VITRIATKALLTQLLGGLPRRMRARVPSELLLDTDSNYLSDDGAQSPKRSSEGLLTSPGIPSLVEGVPPDASLIGEDVDAIPDLGPRLTRRSQFDDVPHPEGRGYAKPTCRRPAPVGGYPTPVMIGEVDDELARFGGDEVDEEEQCERPGSPGNPPIPLSNVIASLTERFLCAEEQDEGLGCCKTTVPRRKQMRKYYTKHRKQELKERHKEHMKVRPETLERPGGRTHEKRKTYRPRNYPSTITQPEKLDDPHETRVNNPTQPRQVPQVREHNPQKPVQVRRIEPT
jgi:hypothetical protein